MFLRVAGLPVLPRTDLAAQRRRTMSRCQHRIVSGVTSSRSPWRRAFGITASSDAISARSAQFRFGCRGCCRCRTASWWRRSRISAVCHASSRLDSRSHAASRVISRKTNRRHMTGDHHGRTAGRAILLVGATDEILGTHRLRGMAQYRRTERIGRKHHWCALRRLRSDCEAIEPGGLDPCTDRESPLQPERLCSALVASPSDADDRPYVRSSPGFRVPGRGLQSRLQDRSRSGGYNPPLASLDIGSSRGSACCRNRMWRFAAGAQLWRVALARYSNGRPSRLFLPC
jgi:hypothetical protein